MAQPKWRRRGHDPPRNKLAIFFWWFISIFNLYKINGKNSWTQDDISDGRRHWLVPPEQNYWLRYWHQHWIQLEYRFLWGRQLITRSKFVWKKTWKRRTSNHEFQNLPWYFSKKYFSGELKANLQINQQFGWESKKSFFFSLKQVTTPFTACLTRVLTRTFRSNKSVQGLIGVSGNRLISAKTWLPR